MPGCQIPGGSSLHLDRSSNTFRIFFNNFALATRLQLTAGMETISTSISESWPQSFGWSKPLKRRQSLFDDALSHHLAGRIDHAITRYKRALALDPKHADIHNNLGVALIAKGRITSAITHYERALALNPNHFNARNNLGTALVAQSRFGEAVRHYQYALTINPRHPNTHYNLGIALAGLGKLVDAMDQYRRALALQPDYAEAHNNLGNLLLAQGASDEATRHYRRALAIDPEHASAHNNLGNILRDEGRFDAALTHFNRAISIHPASAEAHYNRAEVKTFRRGDADLAALQALDRRGDSDAYKSIFIQFALSKALEDIGDYDGSFLHLMRANRLKRNRIDYDERATVETFEHAAAAFDGGLPRPEADPSPVPVFVVGMPRSGTTLLEQILASHTQIQGAGELQDLAASEASGLKDIAQMYLSRLPALADGKARIVDKQPDNFLRIGLIRSVLPNARIIHCVRNPIDTCVSCYSKLFTAGQSFSYDLAELGRYYHRYSDLMAHWRHALPADAMLEVAYEDVVNDLEGQARRMIDHCGLDWDESLPQFPQDPAGP